MLDLDKLSELRFGMSEVPKVGGQPGTYEEKWSQWFLERSFFRDFVHRNPRGKKKGHELADAVVVFDDVVLMVQVKAQCGKHEAMAWATEKLLEAFGQLCKTHKDLVEGHIKKLANDLACFFLSAQRFRISSDSRFRPAALIPRRPDTLFAVFGAFAFFGVLPPFSFAQRARWAAAIFARAAAGVLRWARRGADDGPSSAEIAVSS